MFIMNNREFFVNVEMKVSFIEGLVLLLLVFDIEEFLVSIFMFLLFLEIMWGDGFCFW